MKRSTKWVLLRLAGFTHHIAGKAEVLLNMRSLLMLETFTQQVLEEKEKNNGMRMIWNQTVTKYVNLKINMAITWQEVSQRALDPQLPLLPMQKTSATSNYMLREVQNNIFRSMAMDTLSNCQDK
jgi:hypothetical protein